MVLKIRFRKNTVRLLDAGTIKNQINTAITQLAREMARQTFHLNKNDRKDRVQ